MHITLVDTNFDVTSNSLNLKAIDSTQKNIIFFAMAMSERGHKITLLANTADDVEVEGINWKSYENTQSLSTDLLISVQDTEPLEGKLIAKHKFLWIVDEYSIFSHKKILLTLLKQKCKIIYQNHYLIDQLPHNFRLVPKYFLGNGVDKSFYDVTSRDLTKSNALITTHPLRGLDWMIEVWSKFVHNKLPWAELHIYSELLSRKGPIKNFRIRRLKLLLNSKKNCGIFIKQPLPIKLFLKELPKYKVHLNPSINNASYLLSLLESQAAGIPVVSRVNDVVYNLIYDNDTGFITSDMEIFASKTISLLSDNKFFNRISRNARLNTNIKLWKDICNNFERTLT